MPNLLTEGWGGVYLQIVVGLLVFALGVPALILQIAMPPDVQRVSMRRGGGSTGVMFVFMFLYVVLASLFIWVFHPWQRGKVATLMDWLAAGLVTAALLLIVVLWWQQSRWSARENLIDRVERQIRKGYPASFAIRSDRSRLDDLVYLGQKGDGGHDKELAIQAICRLSRYVVDLPTYRGNSVQPFAQGLESIAMSSDPHPSNENVNAIRLALSELRSRILHRGYSDSPDEGVIIRTLERLGSTAGKDGDLSTALMFVEALADSAESLFEIGTVALENNRNLVALSAFRKLSNGGVFIDSSMHELSLLGLSAHFWWDTESGKQVVQAELSSRYSTGLITALDRAAAYYCAIGVFNTADLLQRMRSELSAALT